MVCATAKQVVNRAVARYLCDLYWSLCLHESWAANQLGTFSSKLHGVELIAGSVINWAGHGGSALQEMLEYLVENRPESWTNVIRWQLSSTPTGSDILVWGDGYFKGHEEDQLENERLQRGVVKEEHQLLRKKILSELQALVGVKDQDDASASPGADYVSDIEWFYLVSMSYSFQQGVGTPGRALATGQPVWLMEANKTTNQSFTRARLAEVLSLMVSLWVGQRAGIQTILCVPIGSSVIELGSTDLIDENWDIVQNIKKLFDGIEWVFMP